MGASDARKRRVIIELGEFGYDALEEQTGRYGISFGEFLRAAAAYYLADPELGRVTRWVPSFRDRRDRNRRLPAELGLETSTWRALKEEAERQGVSFERLLEHTVLYLLADLEAGRVASRILESIESAERYEF